MEGLGLPLAAWARDSELILQHSLAHPGPVAFGVVFLAGLLTALGPCTLSLLPVTLAYLAGFGNRHQAAWQRSLSFVAGILVAFVVLGLVSGLMGRIYGQVPDQIPLLVALVSVVMGLNLLGLVRFPLPSGPDPDRWRRWVPPPLAPLAAGLAFGLAATPCTAPVLAVLLTWMAANGQPLVGVLLLACFGAGQVLPLLMAGTAAATLPDLLRLRRVGQWIPPISGVVLLTTGSLVLLSQWP